MSSGGFNTADNTVFASALVSDGTGITTTVTSAGTYYALKSATLFVAGDADGSSVFTVSATNGTFTVADAAGAGTVELEANICDAIGANSATVTGAWHRTRAGVTTLIGPVLRKVEPGTAARSNLGTARVFDDAQNGDAYDFRYTSGTNSDTVITRQAFLSVKKLSSTT
jgi:hypothetical protein